MGAIMASVRNNHFLFYRDIQFNTSQIDILVDAVPKLPMYELQQPPLDVINKLFSVLSVTDASKLTDIRKAIDKVPNPEKAPIKKENIEDILANLVLLANYSYFYINKNDTQNQTFYIKKFYELFIEFKKLLSQQFEDTMQFICNLDERYAFLKVIPYICNVISKQEDELELFRDSELIGHNVIYKIAKSISGSKRNFEKVNIRHHSTNSIIESYAINDIFINRYPDHLTESNVRVNGLICSVISPIYSTNESIPDVPVVYIAWAGTHNDATMAMNKERNAGLESFLQYEQQIMIKLISSIDTIYQKYKKKLELRIVGHSLGGSLSQLCFHGLEASIINGIKFNMATNNNQIDNDLVTDFSSNKSAYFAKLKTTSRFDLTQYKESFASHKLDPKMISKLHLGIWGDPGVIDAVANSTNNLTVLLMKYSEIKLSACFGWGAHDLIAKVGQRRILNNVVDNPNITINIIIIDSGNKLGVIGVVGGVVALAATPFVGSALGLFAVGGMILGAGASAKTSYDEHTRKQFENQSRPVDPYLLYNNKHPQGVEAISKLLNAQHVPLVDKFFERISQNTEARYRLEENKHLEEFKGKLVLLTDHQSIIDYLVNEMNSNFPGKDKCVIYAISYCKNLQDEKNKIDLLNFQDKNKKTLLHYAIDNNNIALAFNLLDKRAIHINLQDNNGNTPLLLIMKKLNRLINNDEFYFLGSRLLELKADVTIENNNKESPISIFKAWKNWGTGQGQIFCKQMSFKLQDTPPAIIAAPSLNNS